MTARTSISDQGKYKSR